MSENPNSRRHLAITLAMVLVSLLTTLLVVLSFMKGILYTPIGTSEAKSPEPGFYIGISIYITIGVMIATSALIRIALRITR